MANRLVAPPMANGPANNKFATATDAHSFLFGTYANSSTNPNGIMGAGGGGATKSGIVPQAYAMAQQQSSAYFAPVGGIGGGKPGASESSRKVSNTHLRNGRSGADNDDDEEDGATSGVDECESGKNQIPRNKRKGNNNNTTNNNNNAPDNTGAVGEGGAGNAGAAAGIIPWNQVTLPSSHFVDSLLSRIAGNVAIVSSVKPGDAVAKKQKMKEIMVLIQQANNNNNNNEEGRGGAGSAGGKGNNGTVKRSTTGVKRGGGLSSNNIKTSGRSPPNTTADRRQHKSDLDEEDDVNAKKKIVNTNCNMNDNNNNNNKEKPGGELKDGKYSFSFPVPSHDSKSPKNGDEISNNINQKDTFQSPSKDMNNNNPDGQSPRNDLLLHNGNIIPNGGSSTAESNTNNNDNTNDKNEGSSATQRKLKKEAEEANAALKAKLEAEAAVKTMTAARAQSLASHSVISHFYDYNGNSRTNLFNEMLNHKMTKAGVTNKSILLNNLNGTSVKSAASGKTEPITAEGGIPVAVAGVEDQLDGTVATTTMTSGETAKNGGAIVAPRRRGMTFTAGGLENQNSFNRSDFLAGSAANGLGGGGGASFEPRKRVFEQEYTKHQMLGRGSFGETWLVEWTGASENDICPSAYSALACTKPHVKLTDGKQIPADKAFVCKVEAKSMAKKKGQGGNAVGAEERILANCAHPCIVAYVEEFDDKSHHYLVMEYVDGGDLRQEVQRRSEGDNVKYFSEASLLFLFVQIVMAVEYLHRYNVLHRDLKSANILLSKKWLIKLADFGFAKQYDQQDVDHGVSTTTLGTPYYMAPELFRRETYSDKADMWSLGCILYELITLRRPFDGESVQALAHAVINDDYADLQRDNISEELVALLDALLDKDPYDRPSAKQVLQSAIMRNAMEEFIQKFSRAAVASNSALDKSWCKVLLEHQQIVLADTLSSPKSRVAMSRMRSVAMSNRMMSSNRGGGGTSRGASRKDYDDDDD